MGNCCDESRIPMEDFSINQKQLAMSKFVPNSIVLSQLRSLPPISKNIANRMEELGPFQDDPLKSLGRIYQMRNKAVYQGQIKNKMFNGPGKLILGDGSVIESIFQNGEPTKKTRIFKTNGDYFSGTINVQDKKQYGIVYQKGIKYEGDMINQKPHGYGKEITKNYTFAGTYENGRKVNGLLRWNLENPKHIQQYQGGFEDNLFEGPGTLKNNEGKYSGNFQKGQKSGYGVLEEPSGKRYQGYFQRNKPNGDGKLFDQNGVLIMQGTWLNGKPQASQQGSQVL